MLTKELIANVAQTTGMTKRKTEDLVIAMTQAIHDALMDGQSVQLQGLGALEIKQKNARTIVHPKTGERTDVPAKMQLGFRPTSNLKEELKKG